MMYLTLSVAGHLTIFQARTRGPFWSIRPARILLLAVIGTQALATCIAIFGIFMTPLGWRYAALVWGYALVWFLVTDRVKLLGYRALDPSGTAADKLATSQRPRLPEPTWPRWPRALLHSTLTSTPARASPCTTTPARAPTARRSSATATHRRALVVAGAANGARRTLA